MNYGSEPADQVVRYSLEGAEFALRISGTAAKNFFIFAQAVLHDSKKTHGKTHLIRLLKEQKPLKFFTVDKDRMHDFARAAKAHGLLFCPIRDKMDPDHIEIAILQDDASKAKPTLRRVTVPPTWSRIGMGLTPPLSTLTAWLPCMAIWAKNSSGAFCRM